MYTVQFILKEYSLIFKVLWKPLHQNMKLIMNEVLNSPVHMEGGPDLAPAAGDSASYTPVKEVQQHLGSQSIS